MRREKSAGIVIFRRDGLPRFLLLKYKRLNDERGEHAYWDFPKGHVEAGETETQAALREAEEETGLSDIVLVKGFKETIEYYFRTDDTIRKQVVFFLGETHAENVTISDEHLDFSWQPYGKALAMLGFKNAKQVLTAANEFLARTKTLRDFS